MQKMYTVVVMQNGSADIALVGANNAVDAGNAVLTELNLVDTYNEGVEHIEVLIKEGNNVAEARVKVAECGYEVAV